MHFIVTFVELRFSVFHYDEEIGRLYGVQCLISAATK